MEKGVVGWFESNGGGVHVRAVCFRERKRAKVLPADSGRDQCDRPNFERRLPDRDRRSQSNCPAARIGPHSADSSSRSNSGWNIPRRRRSGLSIGGKSDSVLLSGKRTTRTSVPKR